MSGFDRLCPRCEGEGQFTSERTSSGVDANGPYVVIDDTIEDCPTCGGWGRIDDV